MAPSRALIHPPPEPSYPALFFTKCFKSEVAMTALAPFVMLAETITLWLHWRDVGEALRFDGRIRMRRWHNRIDDLADGKRAIQKAFNHTKKRSYQKGTSTWVAWAAKEKRIKTAATVLALQRAFIHKWRVEFMNLAAELKKIKDRIREVVDPEAAAKIRGVEAFEELIKIKKMFIRARQHHVKTYLVRKWGGAIAKKKALQVKRLASPCIASHPRLAPPLSPDFPPPSFVTCSPPLLPGSGKDRRHPAAQRGV